MVNTLLRLTLALLLVSGMTVLFRSAPPEAPLLVPLVVVALLYGPLLLMAAAVWRLHPRSLVWLCFLLLFYFCGFVIQCFKAPPANYWGLWHTLLTVALFTLSLLSIRRGSRVSG